MALRPADAFVTVAAGGESCSAGQGRHRSGNSHSKVNVYLSEARLSVLLHPCPPSLAHSYLVYLHQSSRESMTCTCLATRNGIKIPVRHLVRNQNNHPTRQPEIF